MQINIAEQGVFRFEPAFSADEARGRAGAYKPKAFGTLSQLFARPKDEDITLEDQGLRFEPLWHTKAHLHFVYDCRETHRLSPKARFAKSVTVGTDEYQIAAGNPPGFDIRLVEHCERDERKELWLDAVTNKPIAAQAYAKANLTKVELSDLASDGVQIVQPTVRASGAIRTLLGSDFQPVDADAVKDESIDVECIDLCLRPFYAFRYTWAAKNKTADISLDGITGEIRVETKPSVVSKLLQPDTLFDIGAETLNLVVPGGAIALKVARAIADRREAK